jgi:hypothetical protein
MEVGGQPLVLAVLSSRKEPLGTHCIEDWIPSRYGRCRREKNFLPMPRIEHRLSIPSLYRLSCPGSFFKPVFCNISLILDVTTGLRILWHIARKRLSKHVNACAVTSPSSRGKVFSVWSEPRNNRGAVSSVRGPCREDMREYGNLNWLLLSSEVPREEQRGQKKN